MTGKTRLVVYSDLHYHQYSNGITLEDVVSIDQQILSILQDYKPDLWLFAGDRFASRNPIDCVRLAADTELIKKNNTGIPGFILIGNHDKWNKSATSGHSLKHAALYPNDLENITIMDEKRTYIHPHARIHAIPYGYELSTENFQIDKNVPNICVFHKIVAGSRLQNGMISRDGVSSNTLDISDLNIVLGGDNHEPQELKLQSTKGLVIGAPMQHNWGDRGSNRRILLIEIGKETKVTSISLDYPKFIKTTVDMAPGATLLNWISQKCNEWAGNIIWLIIEGKATDLHGIVVSQWELKLKEITKARSIKIQLKYTDLYDTKSNDNWTSDEQEWSKFVDTRKDEFTDVDSKEIEKLGLKYIGKIR